MSTSINERDSIVDKDALIEHLRDELTTLGRQVEEFQDLRMSIVKVSGKNGVRKLKAKALTTSDRVNGHCIGTFLRNVLWPDIKMMPSKWHKWSKNPRSICKRILGSVGVPRGVTDEDYWSGVAVSMANDKLCAMRSNMKQAMFDRFVGKRMKASNKNSITTLILFFVIPVDSEDQKNEVGVLVEYDDGVVLPSARSWVSNNILHPSYSDAAPLLHFLDKYTVIIVGGSKAMGKYCKINKGKTLLDRVTESDIAYGFLLYENSYDVWKEEIVKLDTCATVEEKKAFEHVALNKYHVQRGTRLPLYSDGWTPEGRKRFDTICGEVRDMMKSEELWSTLQAHWKTYVAKNHRYSYVLRNITNESEHDDNVETSDDDDDHDCIVHLSGDKDDFLDGDSDAAMTDSVEQGRKKRMRVVPV